MKRTIQLLTTAMFLFLCGAPSVHGQFFKKLKKKAEQAAERAIEKRVEEKAEKETEKAMDSLLNGSSKNKKGQSPVENRTSNETNQSAQHQERNSGYAFKSYSKFDFISGEELLTFEDFSQDEVGDLPAKWNATNSVEVVTLQGIEGKWAKLVQGKGAFVPDFITDFPENFTLEFDVIYDFDIGEYALYRNLAVVFSDIENPGYDLDSEQPGNNGFVFTISGGISYNGFLEYQKYTPDKQLNTEAEKENALLKKDNKGRGKVHHVSIWRQKQRMRVYFNEEKVFDIPRAFQRDVSVNTVRFLSNISVPNTYFFISNLRYAIGKPDMRSKLISEGRLVTYGITFDVNSSDIKSSSFGTLKKIATVLKENPTIEVSIVGHTDADGSEEANQSLSEKRAAAVKLALVHEFGVSAGQLSSVGKGESELLDIGTSPESKAKNRRVEFIKK